jgi:hypothetical protein
MSRTRRRRTAAVAWTAAVGLAAVVLAAAVGLAGCSWGAASPGDSSSGGASSGGVAVAAGGSCGATGTAADVAVTIRVTKGTVDCATALGVERGYATMIRKGDVPGNGGGAPVAVDGWTCEGYPTPEVLKTGAASECHTASAEVVAVLVASSLGT